MIVAIVEDDKHQQENVVRLLHAHVPDVRIIGIADSVDEATKLLSNNDIDLAIMDVMIKGGTSIDALEILGEVHFQMIFTTSYDKFALKAFELSATDYLLKPFDEESFIKALKKAQENLNQEAIKQQLSILISNFQDRGGLDSRIAIPNKTDLIFLLPQEIIRCESDNNYTQVFTENSGIIVMSRTLKSVEEMLVGKGFFRVHNRSLINLRHVKKISKSVTGNLILSDGTEIVISRRRRDEFLKVMNLQNEF